MFGCARLMFKWSIQTFVGAKPRSKSLGVEKIKIKIKGHQDHCCIYLFIFSCGKDGLYYTNFYSGKKKKQKQKQKFILSLPDIISFKQVQVPTEVALV